MAISVMGIGLIVLIVVGYFYYENKGNKLTKQVKENKLEDKAELEKQIQSAKDKIEVVKLQRQLKQLEKDIEELK